MDAFSQSQLAVQERDHLGSNRVFHQVRDSSADFKNTWMLFFKVISYNKWIWAEVTPLFPVLFHFLCGCVTVPNACKCSVAFEAFLLPNHFCFLKFLGKVHWNPNSKVLKAFPQYWNKNRTHWSWLAWEHCSFAFWENIKPHLCRQKLDTYISMLPWG